MHAHKNILLVIFNLFCCFIDTHQFPERSYKEISALISAYKENDERAMVFVDLYLNKARDEDNLKRLIRGYEEAIYYSKMPERKLLYADSAIIFAMKSGDQDQIARSYLGKGIVYYYNRRQYKPALDEYLLAFKYSKNSKDLYLKNKITYHLGMVKSYLGYYNEAVEHFTDAGKYFQRRVKEDNNAAIKINNERGYFNSIYRLSTCYKHLQQYRKEDSLINIGLAGLQNRKEFLAELGLFRKGKGIQMLRQGRAVEAIEQLTAAKDILSRVEDHASLTNVFFHLGNSYMKLNDRTNAISYFKKVDSLVKEFRFITPEIRSNYEILINDAKDQKDKDGQLYYTEQLLKADSIINADFAMLSAKLHREYDTDTLREEKNKLEKKHGKDLALIYIALGTGMISMAYIIARSRKRENKLNLQYRQLLMRLQESETQQDTKDLPAKTDEKSLYSAEIIEGILSKLKEFENQKQFLEQNLTVPEVAKMMNSNRTHLSYVLNVQMGISFPNYLKHLRIDYITKLLLEDSKFLNYSIDALAVECGMTNRQKFSSHFLEINGMRPTDFIRKRQQEIRNN